MENHGLARQTVGLTNNNQLDSKQDVAPLVSKSEETFYTARSREPSAHNVEPNNSILESGNFRLSLF